MRATNFSVKDSIHFGVGGVKLDMHNDYDFTGFSYDVPARALLLAWRHGTGKWVASDQPDVALLEIRAVTSLAVEPRTNPFTDDDCLNEMCFVTDEERGHGGFQTDAEPDDAWRWRFDFMSGVSREEVRNTLTVEDCTVGEVAPDLPKGVYEVPGGHAFYPLRDGDD